MLDEKNSPIAWAMLLHELDDAREHLKDLSNQMAEAGTVDDEDFRIQLGHVFAHLNRAWHGRNDPHPPEDSVESHVHRSRFPDDLEPVG